MTSLQISDVYINASMQELLTAPNLFFSGSDRADGMPRASFSG